MEKGKSFVFSMMYSDCQFKLPFCEQVWCINITAKSDVFDISNDFILNGTRFFNWNKS